MRLIDADEAIRISKEDQFMWVYDLTDLEEFLAGVPTIEAEPAKRGRWILHDNGSGTCDQCRFTQKNVWDDDNQQNYCGVCGTKMDGGDAG